MADVVGSGFSPAPGSSTLGDIRDQVARYVKMPNAAQGLQVAEQHIKSAIRKYNLKDWQVMLVTTDLTTAEDDEYSLPNDFKKTRNLQALDSAGKRQFRFSYLDPKSFNSEVENEDSAGTAYRYTVKSKLDDGKLKLGKTPDGNFVSLYPTLQLDYYKNLQYPTTPGANFGVTSEVEAWILWQAKAYMASDFMPQKIAYAQLEANFIWKELIAHNHVDTDWD